MTCRGRGWSADYGRFHGWDDAGKACAPFQTPSVENLRVNSGPRSLLDRICTGSPGLTRRLGYFQQPGDLRIGDKPRQGSVAQYLLFADEISRPHAGNSIGELHACIGAQYEIRSDLRHPQPWSARRNVSRRGGRVPGNVDGI